MLGTSGSAAERFAGVTARGRSLPSRIKGSACYLTAVGIDLKEVRVVGDEEKAIIDALNALRHRYTYVFTTGGIGSTHADVTADCVAKGFGVPSGLRSAARGRPALRAPRAATRPPRRQAA